MPPMAMESVMVPIGTAMPSFTLPSVDGRTVSDTDFADAPALVVIFLSNHCPYVRRIEQALGAVTAQLGERGVATVGICSNDIVNYPEDGADHLREQIARAHFPFPYLIDETQQTAKDFHAACTPDLFVYDAERRLAYRGQFDEARPANTLPA
ncbi:MAG: thioredoxin family protein, partial [Mycobacterium sp.]|nr:thioredoxin family protein [Mycobacterium sp.]